MLFYTKIVMRWLLFLSRLAFICNLFFLLSFSLQFYDWSANNMVVSTILIIGYLLAIIINPITNIIYFIVSITGKKHPVPGWLVTMNVLFLIMQLVYIILINPMQKVPS